MRTKPSPTKADKVDRNGRRARKQPSDRRRDRSTWAAGDPLGPPPVRVTVDSILGFDPGGRWEDVRPTILPLLPRVRRFSLPDGAPVELRIPPGIVAGFGVDVGPALAYVSPMLLARWGIDEATLLGAALDNLRRRVVEEPPQIEHGIVEGAPITLIQAQGWGSALILAPDRLRPLIGAAPRTILTPVRNTLVALPEDVDPDVAVFVWETVADHVRDELDVIPLRWTGADVIVGEGAATGWVH